MTKFFGKIYIKKWLYPFTRLNTERLENRLHEKFSLNGAGTFFAPKTGRDWVVPFKNYWYIFRFLPGLVIHGNVTETQCYFYLSANKLKLPQRFCTWPPFESESFWNSMVVPVIAGKTKVIPWKVLPFSEIIPPRWTVPFEFSPELLDFPYKWQVLAPDLFVWNDFMSHYQL